MRGYAVGGPRRQRKVTPVILGGPRRHRGAADLRPCQDLATSYESEFRHLGRPVLVLHRCGHLNVSANDVLTPCRTLPAAGKDDVQQAFHPRFDHYSNPVIVGRAVWVLRAER